MFKQERLIVEFYDQNRINHDFIASAVNGASSYFRCSLKTNCTFVFYTYLLCPGGKSTQLKATILQKMTFMTKNMKH